MAGASRFRCCSPSVVMPFGFSWSLTPAMARSFMSSPNPELEGFPVQTNASASSLTLAWPGVVLEFGVDPPRLIAVEYSWATLSPAMRNVYMSLCEMRILRPQ
jgi:hypothetical protein